MAITQEEQKKLQQLKQEGYSFKDALAYIGGQRTGRESSISLSKQKAEDPVNKDALINKLNEDGFSSEETIQDLKQTGSDIKESAIRGADVIGDVKQSYASGEQGVARSFGQIFGQGAKFAADTSANLFKGGIKAILPQKGEDALKSGVGSVMGGLGKFGDVITPDVAQDKLAEIINSYEMLDPQAKRDVDAIFGTAALGLEVTGAVDAVKGVKGLVSNVAKVNDANYLVKAFNEMDSMFPVGKKYGSVDDVIKSADSTLGTLKQTPTAEARALAEATAPRLSLQENWAGLTPDIKGRIQQAGPDLMQEYLDVVKTRNITDTIKNPKTGIPRPAPTAYEYGGDYARQATRKMEDMLNDTGSKIGQTRQKLGSVKANIDQVKVIETQFKQGLDDLGLHVDALGNIKQKTGTIKKYGSTADITSLQDMWFELQTLKQSPTLTNMIDYRNFVQKNIKFGKTSQTTSGAIEPFAKKLRYKVKEVANNIVGKTEANRLDDYSKFMEAFDDIKSYTDKRAGGEYLLRLSLSGRGGEARAIADVVKKYTGIDLMDHATLMTTTTDMLANTSQKNLFRQEITKSGLDVAKLLSGDPRGAVPILAEFIQKRFLDPEEILKEASGSFKQGTIPKIADRIKNTPNKQGGFIKVGKETELPNEDSVTKSQLKDIWNKANNG